MSTETPLLIALLHFVFTNFWTWIGCVILVICILGGFSGLIRTIFVRSTWSVMERRIVAAMTKALKDAKQ